MRIVFAAIALCALSFVAGVAGDLSVASSSPPSRSGTSVVLLLPPDVVRAGPLPPLETASAVAAPAPRRRVAPPPVIEARALIPLEKPRTTPVSYEIKDNPDLAPKQGHATGDTPDAAKTEA